MSWTRTAPDKPGWYWATEPVNGPFIVEVRNGRVYDHGHVIDRSLIEHGPRIPSPEAIEKACAVLEDAVPHAPDTNSVPPSHRATLTFTKEILRAAIAALRGAQ